MNSENKTTSDKLNDSKHKATIPPDNPERKLTIAKPNEDQSLTHIGLVGDTYTILVSGKDTDDKFTLIDMYVPPGGGPPPHRHDFEESFIVLEGEIETTFRGEKSVIRAGETVNVPANSPHAFHNKTDQPVRLLCICAPAGQEEFFMEVGVPVATRTTPPPKLSKEEQGALIKKVLELAPKYKSDILLP
jgi:quercetin dioxygenase-like cupin family protein